MKLELHGLEVFGRHGVLEAERREGQTFLFDVELDVAEPGEDRIGATVDYRDVAACVAGVSDGKQYDLLESLAAAVADALVERFPATRARVRVRKRRPPDVPAAWAAATAERPRPS